MRTYQVMVQLVDAGLPIQLGGLETGKAKEAIRALRPAVEEGLVHAWPSIVKGSTVRVGRPSLVCNGRTTISPNLKSE